MTTEKLDKLIQEWASIAHPRATGNAACDAVIARIAHIMPSGRKALVALIQRWLGLRILPTEDNTDEFASKSWNALLALRIAVTFRLNELLPCISCLRMGIANGKTYLPYYTSFCDDALKTLETEPNGFDAFIENSSRLLTYNNTIEYALSYDDMQEALALALENEVAIFGVKIHRIGGCILTVSDDCHPVNRYTGESFHDYVVRSVNAVKKLLDGLPENERKVCFIALMPITS